MHVRPQVSAELLYIAQAPKLKLTEDDFVRFPDVSHLTDSFDKTKWKVNYCIYNLPIIFF